MFDRIADVLIEFASLARCATVIEPYKQGLVLTLGKPRRKEPVLGPGFHWQWPLGIDAVLTENVVPATETLSAQSVDTVDDHSLVFSLMVKWRVGDLRKFLLEVEDADSVLEDVVAGTVAELVTVNELETVRSPDFWAGALKTARRECRKYGIVLEDLKYRDLSKVQTIRLMGEVDTGAIE